MSAKTRQKHLARLASLTASAVSLISSDRRDQKMINALLDALQFFKEGELGSVERNQSSKVQNLQKRKRREFYFHYVKPWIEKKSGVTPPEIIFDFSRSVYAAFFTGSLPELSMLLQKPESFFSSLPQGQAVLREIKEKVAPYGLHFGMSKGEVEEAFGSPLEKYLNL